MGTNPGRVFFAFNLCEGLLWIGVAMALAVAFHRTHQYRDYALAGGLIFLAFGISDFVELGTGAWYRPWWLLLWKAACVLSFIVVYARFRKRRQAHSGASSGLAR